MRFGTEIRQLTHLTHQGFSNGSTFMFALLATLVDLHPLRSVQMLPVPRISRISTKWVVKMGIQNLQ